MKLGFTNVEILLEVVKQLEENEIKHNLCFNQKNSRKFKIVVSDTIDFDVIKVLFDITITDSTDKFLRFEYKDIEFTFIKINISNFNIATFYYSWDHLRLLLVSIFDKLNMDFTDSGLFYRYDKDIYLTNNIKYILDYLDLDDTVYRKGFDSPLEEVKYLLSSIYFSPLVFDIKILEDDFFKNDKKILIEFLKEKEEEINMLLPFSFYENDNEEKMWDTVDVYFKGFLEKIYKIKAKRYIKK